MSKTWAASVSFNCAYVRTRELNRSQSIFAPFCGQPSGIPRRFNSSAFVYSNLGSFSVFLLLNQICFRSYFTEVDPEDEPRQSTSIQSRRNLRPFAATTTSRPRPRIGPPGGRALPCDRALGVRRQKRTNRIIAAIQQDGTCCSWIAPLACDLRRRSSARSISRL
jgi:hypothetical protein